MQEFGNVLIWATLFQEETDKWTSVESVSVGFLCLFLIFFFINLWSQSKWVSFVVVDYAGVGLSCVIWTCLVFV